MWSDIDDDHYWSGNKSFEEVVNLLVGSSKFRSCVVPADHPFTSCERSNHEMSAFYSPRDVWILTVHLLEHFPHSFDVVMVQEPCFRVLLVFLERNPEGIGNVHRLAGVLTKKDADDTFV